MVVSTGFVVLSAVVGTLVVVVTTMGLEVTTDVTGLASVTGIEVVVSRITVVEAVIGPVANLLAGFVVDTV